MNPFRARKKSHEGGEAVRLPSMDTQVPPVPSASSRTRTFRRNKKARPEPKPELDLATLLPSSDDFRTSLLMPNLSARFSMLREQDDPNSKLGKANDDSVLFPKRASKLNLFTHADLNDIAEVSSLASSIRPPFAYGRSNSYASVDGYGTDDDASPNGSVMGRSRPGEGNKFFGGRQKVYKIPVGGLTQSTEVENQENLSSGLAKTRRGKAVYDDDIAISAFQVHQEEEGLKSSLRESSSERSSRENDRQGSPPLAGYNKNRETSSSTTSGPPNPRMSTAATSVTSQTPSSHHGAPNGNIGTSSSASSSTRPSPVALERVGTKNKRLYGQALDQQIHEQQSSALHRLDSIQRQRVQVGVPFPKNLSKPNSTTSMNDRYQRAGPLYASTHFRAGSPPPSDTPTSLSGFDLGLSEEKPHATSRNNEPGFGRSPPLSPPMSPTFISSLEPNDVGKATASGAFNKPAMPYDDHQYAQRQLQLQAGRETPPPRAISRNENPTGRLRNDSFASVQSSLGSIKYQQTQIFNDNGLGVVPESSTANQKSSTEDHNDANGTFLAGLSSSESEPDRESSPDLQTLKPSTYQSLSQVAHEASAPTKYLHDDRHPAFQPRNVDQPFTYLSDSDQDGFAKSNDVTVTVQDTTGSIQPLDSPTLGPITGLGGLIKAHLRNDSNQSSIYPSPTIGTRHSGEVINTDAAMNREEADSGNTFHSSNSWQKENWKGNYNGASKVPAHTDDRTHAPEPLSIRARHLLEQATILRNESPKLQQVLGTFPADKAQQVLGEEAPRRSQESINATWQEHVKGHHTRGGSTETQKEREDLANELADRRKRVQDSLKSFVETESRSASPMPGSRSHDQSFVKAGGAFGLLKKASRGSLVGKHENPSKAMKMLGIGSSYAPNCGSPHQSQENFLQERDEDETEQTHGNHGLPRPSTSSSSRGSRPSPRIGTSSDQGYAPDRKNGLVARKQTPPSSQPFRRDRSGSDLSSRPPPPLNPNDVHPSQRPRVEARGEDTFQSAVTHARKYSPPRQPLVEGIATSDNATQRSQPATSNRARSNSKSSPAGYFDQKGLLSIQTSYQNNYPGHNSRSPRASPNTLHPSHSTTSFHDLSPALSTASTPTMIPSGAFPSTNRVPAPRKRSINKHDISEPQFMSCTSSVSTVPLPPGASLSNGMQDVDHTTPPPVPPLNPRRKRMGNTQNMFNVFGRSSPEKTGSSPPAPKQTPYTESHEEQSTFSADEGDARPKKGNRLRKISSEGGNLAARARQQATMKSRPPMPRMTTVGGPRTTGPMF